MEGNETAEDALILNDFKEKLRPQHGFRLAHMMKTLSSKESEEFIKKMDKQAQETPKKIPEPTGIFEKDQPYISAMCAFLNASGLMTDALYKKMLNEVDTLSLLLKVSQGIASCLKMTPAIFSKMSQNSR